MIYVAAIVVNEVAKKFEGKMDLLASFKLVAYSATPAYLAEVFYLIPGLKPLILLGAIYSIYTRRQ